MLKSVCFLLFIGLAASDSSVSSAISQILSQAKNTRSRAPVILIINSKALQDSSSVEAPTFRQSSEEIDTPSVLNMLLGQLQKSRPKPTNRYRVISDQASANRNKQSKKFPVYKSLLTLRNSLRCGARDECKNDCTELPKKQEKKCKKKCAVIYECEEEPKCDDNDCDEDNSVSTRGPPASVEKFNKCPRC